MQKVFVFAVCTLLLAGGAYAVPVLNVGSPSGDWSLGTGETTPLLFPTPSFVGQFDVIEVKWVTGDKFDVTSGGGLGSLSSGWAEIFSTPTDAVAVGPATNLVYFTLNFIGSSPTVPTVYNLQAYYQGQCVDDWAMDQNGSWWGYNGYNGTYPATYPPDPYLVTPPSDPVSLTGGLLVPEPVSMVFFGTGIVGVVGYVARRKMLKQA